jgi:hypothetical protein
MKISQHRAVQGIKGNPRHDAKCYIARCLLNCLENIGNCYTRGVK